MSVITFNDQEISYPVYSPASVMGIFSNALKLNATVNLIYLKERYAYGGGKAYGNYYYDNLFSEGDNVSIGLRISALLRSKVSNNEIYTLRGYIEKNIKNSSIELRFVVDEIIQHEERSISEEELQRYGLIQKKLGVGSKDLETLIRDKMLKDEISGLPISMETMPLFRRTFLRDWMFQSNTLIFPIIVRKLITVTKTHSYKRVNN